MLMVKMIFQEPCLRLKRFGCQRNSGSIDRVSLAKLAMDSLMYSGALTMMLMKSSNIDDTEINNDESPPTHPLPSDGDEHSSNINETRIFNWQ